jgi:3-deoxy-D-manno-octulosonic-acid transferase
MQSEEDRSRLIRLGVPPERVQVTGNLKFDAAQPTRDEPLEQLLGHHQAGRPLLIAGSTMPGEEEMVLEAFERAGGGGRALLLLAPRHPERWDSVEAQIRNHGATVRRRSELSPEDSQTGLDVILLDTMGELAGLYAVCEAAFVGGTLVPTGGHNPIEPARFGAPIAAGPSMENFRAIANEFDHNDSWIRVADIAALSEFWRAAIARDDSLAEAGRRAAELIERNQGALERTLDLLEPLLPATSPEGA